MFDFHKRSKGNSKKFPPHLLMDLDEFHQSNRAITPLPPPSDSQKNKDLEAII